MFGGWIKVLDPRIDEDRQRLVEALARVATLEAQLAAERSSREAFARELQEDHNSCRFGKWYASKASEFGYLASYRAIEEPHRLFHSMAAEAMQARAAGDYATAETRLSDMDVYSDLVIGALDALGDEIVVSCMQQQSRAELF
ncbi:hypothetical protein RHDC4_00277 [Rhodocyclaceae bacterium]|nr:hypothetical protein RHDC4_00277 [Rhodocyclaceae bacterium]